MAGDEEAYGKITMESNVHVYGGFEIGDDSKDDRNWKENQTALDAGGNDIVVSIDGFLGGIYGCRIDGFVIQNGNGSFGIGGIYCCNTDAVIANNIICRNNGVGLYADPECDLTVIGNVFVGNNGTGGGIYYSDDIGGQITNNTIIKNHGDGIYLYQSSPVLTNNIIAYNSSYGINKDSNSNPSFTQNDVYGNNTNYSWTAGHPAGDISPANPGIPNIEYGDWHITETSSCKDQGSTVTLTKDIDADARVTDSVVDIGADEWSSDPEELPSFGYPSRLLVNNQYNINVNYSCPLVADLIPGDNGANEIAVIAKQRSSGSSWISDGKAYILRANGTLAWTSKDRSGNDLTIDANGNNTLSAADIDQVQGSQNLELIAPSGASTNVYAFGYDAVTSTIKPIAGWPVSTVYDFSKVAAAIGDANLDGTQEVVAGDDSCYVFSWNPSGTWTAGSPYLWRQLTGTSQTTIENSSVALGDINHYWDTNRIPDILVGSHNSNPLFGFPGDCWGDLTGVPVYTSGSTWPKTGDYMDCSPAIGLIDEDSDNDFAVGADDGKLYLWLSSTQTYTSYTLSSDANKKIESAPVIAEFDGQRCVIVGCNDGKVYAIKSDGTPITGWPSRGISPSWYMSGGIIASPLVADVMNTGSPQIVVACTNGDVYALWPDGNNHLGGPIAAGWRCAQEEGIEINSTPTVCSLDGTNVSMIVGSGDGIYNIDLYTLEQGQSFISNGSRWPWPTFHRDNARTGCTTSSSSPVSASISGKVTLNDVPVQGARISIRMDGYPTQPPAVYGRSSTRTDPVLSVGNTASSTDEYNEGQYCISQLPPNSTYNITATDANGQHQVTITGIAVTTGKTNRNIQLTP